MPLTRDRCLCLRKVEYSETSQILLLFSRHHGLLRAIAKGAHRRTKAGASKFDGGVDLLDLGDAVFTHDPQRDLSTLTEWHLTDGHLSLRNNLRALYLAQYAAELVASLLEEHDAHPDLFDRLEHTLDELATARAEESFLAFQLDLLRETGYLPELSACVVCAELLDDRHPSHFSPSRGGIVCQPCLPSTSDKLYLDPRLLRLIQAIIKLPRTNGTAHRLPKLTRHQTDPLNLLFSRHVQHTLSRPLRLAPYVLPDR
jgi:DNA repair protein RecO (recombination protein O)